MKILHTSDWHLGKVLFERSLIEDQRFVLEQIHRILKNKPHDLFIISGDIYDRSLPSVEAVGLLSWFLTDLRKFSDIHVAIIPGNHDSAARMSYCSELMSISNIYFHTDPLSAGIPVQIEAGDTRADIYLMPYLDPNTYNIHDDDKTGYDRPTHESAVKEAISLIKKNFKKDRINILAAHLFTSGGITTDSERKFVGTAGNVDPTIIAGFDYIALGHLHKPQPVTEKMFYSGSILKYSFSESLDEKHVLSIDFKNGSPHVVELHINPLRDMIRLKDKFNELMYSERFNDYREFYIEADLLDVDIILNPMSSLRTRFPNILSVKQTGSNDIDSSGRIDVVETEEENIENDFINFHRYIHEENPGVDKLTLFSEIQRGCEKNETS